MPKIRLNIGHREIIMKDIINVIIDGVEYRKNDYINENDNRTIQGFYNFVKKFKEKITYICYKIYGSSDYICFMYIKDGKLHSLTDYAIYEIMLGNGYKNGSYFIYGEKLTITEWQRKVRKYKLENLKK